MKILIAVDDSTSSDAAVRWVERMCWPTATEFLVLSAVPQPVVAAYAFADAPAPAFSAQLYEEELHHHQEIAARAEGRLRERGMNTRAIVLPGDPRDIIVEAARGHGVSMVVMGSRGRTGFSKLLLGSVASHVVTHAPCSVLVVKDGAQAAGGRS
jgi:nucleotide-binding universal stress UspA family protein